MVSSYFGWNLAAERDLGMQECIFLEITGKDSLTHKWVGKQKKEMLLALRERGHILVNPFWLNTSVDEAVRYELHLESHHCRVELAA